ncbi:hypothetical protein [Natrinema versiforme]|uniref:Uncharacterized protein n=1 Tax=Natrinema versiforme TaxID=88724 RepID=A0A4P8WK77_9EURY|nr:hypothetical protein [Natrinema versiforme]QCS43890.1 hypothetical protein FEJ81_16620 [Natrinema versiforme]
MKIVIPLSVLATFLTIISFSLITGAPIVDAIHTLGSHWFVSFIGLAVAMGVLVSWAYTLASGGDLNEMLEEI